MRFLLSFVLPVLNVLLVQVLLVLFFANYFLISHQLEPLCCYFLLVPF